MGSSCAKCRDGTEKGACQVPGNRTNAKYSSNKPTSQDEYAEVNTIENPQCTFNEDAYDMVNATNDHRQIGRQVSECAYDLVGPRDDADNFDEYINYMGANDTACGSPDEYSSVDVRMHHPDEYSTANGGRHQPDEYSTANGGRYQPDEYSTVNGGRPQPDEYSTVDGGRPQPDEYSTVDGGRYQPDYRQQNEEEEDDVLYGNVISPKGRKEVIGDNDGSFIYNDPYEPSRYDRSYEFQSDRGLMVDNVLYGH